ncbi:MAG: flavodoxin family protein [Desulfovibrionaceae bacterium]|nr:flavodoxin family protein [Desulfovibrionaceae bacterium]
MSRILVLAGSPRVNGNTDRLVASFAEGAGKNHVVEIASVHDYAVSPCIGCNSCFSREGNECFQHDDMSVIYAKLREADTLIIASPVYFYGLSAQLKAVIDRLHTPMRNSFPIRRLGLILVGAAVLPEMFDAILAQYRLALNFFSLEDAGTVLARGAKDKGDVSEKDLLAAYRFGESL